MRLSLLGLTAAMFFLPLLSTGASAQYFGKNKVHYSSFNWNVLETEHFQIYYYDSERDAAVDAARIGERSYARLSHVLRHEFTKPIPLVLYASHSQFQQTNILPDHIDEGTRQLRSGEGIEIHGEEELRAFFDHIQVEGMQRYRQYTNAR